MIRYRPLSHLLARGLIGYWLLLHGAGILLHRHPDSRTADTPYHDSVVVNNTDCPVCDGWVRAQMGGVAIRYSFIRTEAQYDYFIPACTLLPKEECWSLPPRGPPA